MKNIVKIKPKRKNYLITLEQDDKNISVKEFMISKDIGDETGWKNDGSINKIVERTNYLQTNKFIYEKNRTYNHETVLNKLNILVNDSDDKLKSMRKMIEIFDGYNCVGSTRVEVIIDNKQMNLKEYVDKYLK